MPTNAVVPGMDRERLALDEDTMLRRQVLEQSAEAYIDTSQTRYIHLADGGITDNLDARPDQPADFLRIRRAIPCTAAAPRDCGAFFLSASMARRRKTRALR
jgi:hypothetical protein